VKKSLLPSASDLLAFALAFVVPCIVILGLMPKYIDFLRSNGRSVPDVHKAVGTKVVTPAGPLLIVGLILGEAAVFFVHESTIPVVVIEVALGAGAIGLYDDLRGLGGVVKPALMMLVAAPLILEQQVNQSLYTAQLYFPFFGSTGTHFIIFAILIVASMPVSSNAFNMLDSFNGEISSFTFIAALALIAGILMRGYETPLFNWDRLAATLPLAAVSLAFYFYNRYPSKIFDGDSGSLMFGATYAALAIMGGVEIAALVAAIPAVLNSYYIILSVRGFVEHKRMGARPTHLGDDGKLYASDQPGAPTTLVRMILLGAPMGERELVRSIVVLAALACALSVITSATTWLI
jgi:UDP-N-acetylglucosamine--dolichyl-phosphate N-acetylglucosaminephosphotransferase